MVTNLSCKRKCLHGQFVKLLMKKLDFSPDKILQKAAHHLISQGFSVIPVHGDNDKVNPKKPATMWKTYQRRLAHPSEIDAWFEQNITAIGIVCGQISKLMVLDFDDEYTYREFLKAFPQYRETFTVKTKRGYHLYFKVEQKIATYKFDGGDIKGEKSYVIAPPSQVDGWIYTIIKPSRHMSLSPSDVDNILNYLQVNTIGQSSKIMRNHLHEDIDLLKIYDTLMPQIGRNNALYRTASIAHTYGYSQEDTEDILTRHHINQPAPLDHANETPDQRYIEAIRTINSAYSNHHVTYISSAGLPNSIREALLQVQHSTIAPRLLDVMWLAGWKANQYFSMADLVALAKTYGINRKSVMALLTGDLSIIKQRHLIVREYVEYPDIWGHNSSQGGRPVEIMYRVPSIERLLTLLDVKQTPSDLITADDVKTAHAYRLALHREYIKRVSPEVPMWWLAERIGVNVRTIQRYNLELNVQKTQNLAYFSLSKTNLDTLPKRTQKVSKNATNGFWLETEGGARYPAWRHIGSQLLKGQSEQVKVVVQKPAKLSLNPIKQTPEDIVWHPIAPAEFVKLQAFRSCVDEKPKLTQVVDNLFQYVKQRVNRVRYYNMQLHFDSVISHIAKDDVAETITSFLFAYDADGELVRRPARRGIAFRMLKEFGNGNVYLALLDSHTEMFYALARHALRFGQLSAAMKFLLSALEEFPRNKPQFAG